jgi:transcriptional regulator of acetoin/glycerol metabolism
MAEGLQTVSHGTTVLAAARGGVPAADYRAFVLESWRRCIDDFGLAPERRDDPQILDRVGIAERREASCHLVEMAKSEMTGLYQQVAGSGYSILLCDADGVVLNYIGDPLFTTAAASAGMVNGARWSETAQGTNGIGTCLMEKRPIVVHREEHFFTKNTGLTCSAAPIFEPTGEIAGVLDASSESRMAQQHTVALVNMSAQLIENRLFICRMRENYVLRFHSRPEFVSTLGEGIIAFDPSGRLRAANRSALFQLGLSTVDEIAGRPIQEIFNLRVDDALSRAQRQSNHPQPLRDVQGGRRFYASFQAPSEQMEGISRGLTIPRPFASMETPTSRLPFEGLQFGDMRMKRNAERAAKLIERDIPFIVLGETGTGKDVFARALHQAGPRRNKPFVAVNCASIPETLIESELFGYRPGAFTGASRDGSRGKIVQAHGGTLFLDEIGDMPLELQARLLRVLEERAVIPLGGETPIEVDIQLISATHQNLKQQVMDGGFREDLYYRLHGLSLQLPPLREREDRRELIRHLLDGEAGGPGRLEIEPEAMALMDAYEWPGNIRQLRNTLRTLVGLSEGGVIRVDDLPDDLLLGEESLDRPARPSNPLDVAERDAILRELEAAHWNVTRVASKLTLSRNTLYRKMKRYRIKPPR